MFDSSEILCESRILVRGNYFGVNFEVRAFRARPKRYACDAPASVFCTSESRFDASGNVLCVSVSGYNASRSVFCTAIC